MEELEAAATIQKQALQMLKQVLQNEPPTWLNGFLEHKERMRIEERQRYEATIGALVQAINSQNNQTQNETDSYSTNVNSIVGKNKLPHPSRPPTLDVEITYSKFLAWKST